ncbi:hypothetical protein Lpp123_15536 [Lacticaseibacillus paracasei subsp. paracasei Lpp123]|uniref:Uncharacterized protein n=1 Tax=Lacticaseibacillus paracasei subsp. paracasei Lpp123 TaxID=1256201 RepID=A0A829GFW2_LACPA|nr:hypothetical protein Lpp123_15536 [Lacticaseibacillus paracasei subsp. paracasei Lpp123]
MNKQQMKLANYGTTINAVVEATQDNQEKMAPLFEPLRKAIDENKLADYDLEAYQQTQTVFSEGTSNYEALLVKLQQVAAPVRLLGPHHTLVRDFAAFTEACKAMTASLHADRQVDVAAFNAAEKAQDRGNSKIHQGKSKKFQSCCLKLVKIVKKV